MANDKTRSYNNGSLTPMQVANFKKKAKRVSTVQVKVGSVKAMLPVETFLFGTEGGYGFLSVQPINAVVQLKADGSYEAVAPKDVAQAVTALKAYRVKSAPAEKGRAAVAVPEELQKLLAQLPKGYKLAVDASGKYKMVKSRERKKS